MKIFMRLWIGFPLFIVLRLASAADIGHLVIKPEYRFDGHFLTVDDVMTVGLDMDEKLVETIKVFTQAPDDLPFLYSAPTVAVWGFFRPVYRHRIVNLLHSLHGGDNAAVLLRRKRLAKLIKDFDLAKTDELWKLGALLHALGDSYAHTYGEAGNLRAYNELYGHALTSLFGKDPDLIDNNLPGYKLYLKALYDSLDRSDPVDQQRRNRFFVWADALHKSPETGEKQTKLTDVQKERASKVLSVKSMLVFLGCIGKTLEAPDPDAELNVNYIDMPLYRS